MSYSLVYEHFYENVLVEHFQSVLKIIIICQIVTTVIKKTKCTRKLGGHGVAMSIIVHLKKK